MFFSATFREHLTSLQIDGEGDHNTESLGLYLRTTLDGDDVSIALARHQDFADHDLVATGLGLLNATILLVPASDSGLSGSITLRSLPPHDERLVTALCDDNDLRAVDSLIDRLPDSEGFYRGRLGFGAVRNEVSAELAATLRHRLNRNDSLHQLRVTPGLRRLVAEVAVARLLAAEGWLEEDEASRREDSARRGLLDVALGFDGNPDQARVRLAKLVRG